MMKKTGGRKSPWNVPFNRIRKSHMTVSYCGEIEIDSAQYDTSKNSNNSAKIFYPIGPLPRQVRMMKKRGSKVSLDYPFSVN